MTGSRVIGCAGSGDRGSDSWTASIQFDSACLTIGTTEAFYNLAAAGAKGLLDVAEVPEVLLNHLVVLVDPPVTALAAGPHLALMVVQCLGEV